MDLVAHIRVVVAVPFTADVPLVTLPPPREHWEGMDAQAAAEGRTAAKQAAEDTGEAASAARAEAARHAETELVAKVTAALAKHGEIVSSVVEEVHEV